MINRLLILSAITTVIACHPQSVEEVFIDDLDSEPALHNVIADTLFQCSADQYSCAAVISGTYCFFNSQQRKDPILTFFNPERGITRKYFMFGSGVEQMLLPCMYQGSGKIVLKDPTLKKVSVIDVFQAIADSTYQPEINKSKFFSQRTIPYNDRLLFLNPYSVKDGPRVIVSDKTWDYNLKRKPSFWAANAVHGDLVYNAHLNRIAYLSKDTPVLELINKNGWAYKRYIYPHRVTELIEVKQGDVIEYLYSGMPEFCFLSACGNDKRIAASFLTDEGVNRIMLFDWDGISMGWYEVGAQVLEISIDEENNIYCWETNDTQSWLIKYQYEI